MFMVGLMKWGPNLYLAMYLNYYPVLRSLGKHVHGTALLSLVLAGQITGTNEEITKIY